MWHQQYTLCDDGSLTDWTEDTQKQSIKDGAGGALFTLLKRGNIFDDEDEKNILERALIENLLRTSELC